MNLFTINDVYNWISFCLFEENIKNYQHILFFFKNYFSVADREESDYMEANIPVGELDKQKVIILKYITCISTP